MIHNIIKLTKMRISNNRIKNPLILLALLFGQSIGLLSASDPLTVSSPDKRIAVNVKFTDKIYYNLMVDGREVMWYSGISMSTSQGELGLTPKLLKSEINSVNQSIKTVWGIRSEIKDEYNQLKLDFQGGYTLLFRLSNEGMAYRFVTTFKDQLIINDEEVEFRFLDNHPMVNHIVDSYATSYEKLYTRQTVNDLTRENLVSLPSVVLADNLRLVITEADLFDYPGLYLTKKANRWPHLKGSFPKYPTAWEPDNDRGFKLEVTKTADFIAKTKGAREFPWRVIIIARSDKELLDNDLVYKLARPSKIETDWIKPGKVSWDWYNALNLQGVDFEAGINTRSYEYFIDFAAKNNIEYVILDEGWSDQFDLLLPTSAVDMEHLTKYAKEKGVGLILWAVWHAIDKQQKEAFELFRKWGIAGVKVDFIDRDDQIAVDFYERFAAEAAKYKLLVDYHGCSKPTGLHRTYPNVVNFEGVRGNEFNKFANAESPGHNVDIAFTRMIVGPMDYTPGAMRNSIEGDFKISFVNPMSHGTRCHQLGMYVVYYAPLQMLCDAPTQYEKYPDILSFLSKVPVTWDDTKVISGKLGEYVVIARKKGEDWYIGGLTNWTERDIEIDLSQFPAGTYTADILRDGINANRNAEDYISESRQVSSTDVLKITMKKGGGFAMVLRKK
jgi:alpha-glucosidase